MPDGVFADCSKQNPATEPAGLGNFFIGTEYLLVFDRVPQALDHGVVQTSGHGLLMLILMFSASSTDRKASLVNWASKSVLKISGQPYLASAERSASTQKDAI